MANALTDLNSAQLLKVYNHHSDKPVAKFESAAIGKRRLNALLTRIEVSADDAVASVFPSRPKAALPEAKAPKKAAKASAKPAKATRAKLTARRAALEASEQADVAAPAVVKVPGKARAAIVAVCSRPEGATSSELYAATTWKHCSWNHHLKVAAAATGLKAEVRKVDGATRYFLLGAARAKAAAKAAGTKAAASHDPMDDFNYVGSRHHY
jgi:hypothetical protein